MKSKIFHAIMFSSLGFFIGLTTHNYMVGNSIEETIDLVSRNESLQAGNYLLISKAIREKKYDEALIFSEGMVEINVNGFTDEGKKLGDLNEHELATIQKVKSYREEACPQTCLGKIADILK